MIQKILKWLRHPGDSLHQRVIHAGVWNFLLRVVTRSFSLLRTIVLARLLAPSDFGLFGIAMLALSSLRAFSKTGFNQALIQKKEKTEPYLNSAWTVQIVRGFVLGSLLILSAPLVGEFFGEPGAVLIVRVLGLAEIIKNLRNIGVIYFQKELEFHKQFLYRFSGIFADLSVALPLAFLLRSVWALVLGLLARDFVQFVVSYFVHGFRPKLNWDFKKIRELFNFGRWILGSSIIIFLLTQGDDIFLGKYLGSTALGFYRLAYRISNTPATEIAKVVSKVTFPAYSKLQDKINTLRDGYFKTLQLTTFIAFPLAAGIAVLSSDFVNIFLGDKWAPMIVSMRILAIFGAIRAFNATTANIFRAKGQPEILTKLSFVQLLILASIIFPFTARWGIEGTSVAIIIPGSFAGIVSAYKARRILDTRIIVFLKKISGPMVSTLVMLSVLVGLKLFLAVEILYFVLLVFVGIFSYTSTMYILERKYGLGYLEIYRSIKKNI